MSVSWETGTSEARPVICRDCQQPNAPHYRFCSHCGGRLWEPCLLCGEKNSCDVEFCGHCGGNLQEALQQRLTQFTADRQKAERLRNDGMYYEAIDLLQRFQGGGDSRLEPLVQAAEQRAEELRHERVQRKQDAEIIFQRAQDLLRHKEYVGAKDELARIPPGLRDEAMRDTWEQINAALQEISDLTTTVRQAHQAQRYDHLLPNVLRLLELRPKDARLARLADDLQRRRDCRDAVVAEQRLCEARELLTQHQYDAAELRLADVAVGGLSSQQRDSYDTVRELGWISRQLRTALVATPQLASITQRLCRMQPVDSRAARWLDEVTRRLKARPQDPRFPIPWGKPPETTKLGYPIRWWRGIRRSRPVDETEVQAASMGRFMVAYGLALQGLGASHLKLNLLPQERSSRWKRWTTSRRPKSYSPVWGIDLGTSGLKAVLLRREGPDAEVQCVKSVYVPHSHWLNAVKSDAEVTEICQGTIRRFVQRYQLSQAHAVIGFPGSRSLGRSFEIPCLKENKLADAIAYEARVQIPLPLDEILFDWHVWPDPDPESNMQSVTMLAARRTHVRRLLESLDESPVIPVAVQSDFLGLYNAAAYEFWPETDAAGSAHTLALLQIGVDASNLVLGSPRWIRFRSLGVGTEKMNRVLATRFHLKLARADSARQEPAQARWMYQLDKELVPVFAELGEATQRTLAAYQNEGLRADQLLITGGGAGQHGLLRHFVFGE